MSVTIYLSNILDKIGGYFLNPEKLEYFTCFECRGLTKETYKSSKISPRKK